MSDYNHSAAHQKLISEHLLELETQDPREIDWSNAPLAKWAAEHRLALAQRRQRVGKRSKGHTRQRDK